MVAKCQLCEFRVKLIQNVKKKNVTKFDCGGGGGGVYRFWGLFCCIFLFIA